MNYKIDIKYSLPEYLLLFLFVGFSGNPVLCEVPFAKPLLILFAGLVILYGFYVLQPSDLNKPLRLLLLVIACIGVLSLFQKVQLGSVSYPGVLALVLKIATGFFLLLIYRKQGINPFHMYVRMMAVLAVLSIPFFALNLVTFTGLPIPGSHLKTFLIYTSYVPVMAEEGVRNPGMFWEPGAHAGYICLALLCIALLNGRFTIGQYKKEALALSAGLLTTMSTTGFLIFAIMCLIYVLQNYTYGKYIMLPLLIVAGIYAYNNLEFLSKKIEEQYIEAVEMDPTDVSSTRFGALNMDINYIKSQPLTGNGLHKSTRFRFHPWFDDEVGHGNGMSNFLAFWGIPFFLLWVICLYRFGKQASGSAGTAILFVLLMLLILQGEQFLNFPLFLIFFTAPAIPLRWEIDPAELERYESEDISSQLAKNY